MSRFMTRVARDIPLLQHINQHEVLLVDHRRDKHFEPWPNPEMFCVKPAASLICSRYNARGSLIIIAFVVKHMKIFWNPWRLSLFSQVHRFNFNTNPVASMAGWLAARYPAGWFFGLDGSLLHLWLQGISGKRVRWHNGSHQLWWSRVAQRFNVDYTTRVIRSPWCFDHLLLKSWSHETLSLKGYSLRAADHKGVTRAEQMPKNYRKWSIPLTAGVRCSPAIGMGSSIRTSEIGQVIIARNPIPFISRMFIKDLSGHWVLDHVSHISVNHWLNLRSGRSHFTSL